MTQKLRSSRALIQTQWMGWRLPQTRRESCVPAGNPGTGLRDCGACVTNRSLRTAPGGQTAPQCRGRRCAGGAPISLASSHALAFQAIELSFLLRPCPVATFCGLEKSRLQSVG